MPTSAVTVCKQHISLQALLCFSVVHYKYFTAWHNERNLLLLMEYYCWQGERGSKRSNSTMICLSNCVFVVAAHEHILILTPSSPLELLHILNCQFHKMCKEDTFMCTHIHTLCKFVAIYSSLCQEMWLFIPHLLHTWCWCTVLMHD